MHKWLIVRNRYRRSSNLQLGIKRPLGIRNDKSSLLWQQAHPRRDTTSMLRYMSKPAWKSIHHHLPDTPQLPRSGIILFRHHTECHQKTCKHWRQICPPRKLPEGCAENAPEWDKSSDRPTLKQVTQHKRYCLATSRPITDLILQVLDLHGRENDAAQHSNPAVPISSDLIIGTNGNL